MTPKELLSKFYEENNLPPDGGQSDSRVRLDIAKEIYFYIPNFDARRKAVLRHDVHHIVTGYSASSFISECEISAWEIASGCKNYWAAFFINMQGIMSGLLINPWRVFIAFARGRRTLNLYHDLYTQEQFMETPIELLKDKLKLTNTKNNFKLTLTDYLAFLGILLIGLMNSIVSILFIPFLVVYNVIQFLKPNQ
jgi:hypothetical protein